MLDHVSLGVGDIARSRDFYDAVLRPLGLVRIVDFRAGKGADYGLASAVAVVIFFIVAGISTLGFMRTKALENLA